MITFIGPVTRRPSGLGFLLLQGTNPPLRLDYPDWSEAHAARNALCKTDDVVKVGRESLILTIYRALQDVVLGGDRTGDEPVPEPAFSDTGDTDHPHPDDIAE